MPDDAPGADRPGHGPVDDDQTVDDLADFPEPADGSGFPAPPPPPQWLEGAGQADPAAAFPPISYQEPVDDWTAEFGVGGDRPPAAPIAPPAGFGNPVPPEDDLPPPGEPLSAPAPQLEYDDRPLGQDEEDDPPPAGRGVPPQDVDHEPHQDEEDDPPPYRGAQRPPAGPAEMTLADEDPVEWAAVHDVGPAGAGAGGPAPEDADPGEWRAHDVGRSDAGSDAARGTPASAWPGSAEGSDGFGPPSASDMGSGGPQEPRVVFDEPAADDAAGPPAPYAGFGAGADAGSAGPQGPYAPFGTPPEPETRQWAAAAPGHPGQDQAPPPFGPPGLPPAGHEMPGAGPPGHPAAPGHPGAPGQPGAPGHPGAPGASAMPGGVPGQPVAPGTGYEPYEPWRLPAPRRRGPRVRMRVLLPIVAGVVAVSVASAAAVVLVIGNDGDSADVAESRLAGKVFTGDPAATADGRDQELTGVAARGSTVVAIGGETDHITQRPQFLVSTDGGRTYKLAAARPADGDEPPPGDVPRHVAAGERGWVSIADRPGGTAIWVSRDGTEWTRQPDGAGEPFGTGTRVNRLIGTERGFLAVGDVSRSGDFTDAAPALWSSEDGRRWERQTGDRLDLGADGGTLSMTDATSGGNTILIQGVHTRRPGARDPDVRNMVWRSQDGGRSWRESKIRAPKGTVGLSIGGGRSGFVAVREIKRDATTYGQSFVSDDGDTWTQGGRLGVRGHLRVMRLLGTEQGQVAVVNAAGRAAIMRTGPGGRWQEAGAVPVSPGKTLLAAAATGDRTVIAGRDLSGKDIDAILAVRDGAGREIPVDLGKVPGAVQKDQVVRDVAAGPGGGGPAVAVGGTDGDAAAWTSTDGRTWRRGRAAGEVFARPGLQRLGAVVPGRAGWLAVGMDGVAPVRALVATSADGAAWKAPAGADVFRAKQGVPLGTYGVAAGQAGYVVVGEEGPNPATWFSSDLKTWQRGTGVGKDALGRGRWMRGAAAGPFGFVAVGGWGDTSVKNAPNVRPAIWTSADGRRWTSHKVRLPAGLTEGSLQYVVAKDRLLVAAGTASTPQGPRPLAYASADGGRTWQETKLPADENSVPTRLAATPQGILAACTTGASGSGDITLWSSRDGRGWTSQEPRGPGLAGAGEQELTGLTVFGDRLLAVGSTSDHRGKAPTLWHRPLP